MEYLSNIVYFIFRDLVSVNAQRCATLHKTDCVKNNERYVDCSKHETECECKEVSCNKKSNIKNRLEDLGTDTRIILNVSLLSDTGRCELDSFAENRDQWRAVWNAVMSLHLIK